MSARRVSRGRTESFIEPIARWDFTEQSGSVCTNKATWGNNLILTKSYLWRVKDGRDSILCYYNTEYGYLNSPDPPLAMGGPVSICVWAKKTFTFNQRGFYHSIFTKGGTFIPDTISLQIYEHSTNGSNRPTFRVKNNNVTSSVATTDGYTDGTIFDEWTHICGTIDENVQKIYVNGVEGGSSGTVVLPRERYESWWVSHWTSPQSTQEEWEGWISDLRIYPVALSAKQVAAIANGTD